MGKILVLIMNVSFKIYVNVAKKTKDGSYKPNELEFKDTDACKFLMKWVGKGFIELLTNIGEPPNCPVKAVSIADKIKLILLN